MNDERVSTALALAFIHKLLDPLNGILVPSNILIPSTFDGSSPFVTPCCAMLPCCHASPAGTKIQGTLISLQSQAVENCRGH